MDLQTDTPTETKAEKTERELKEFYEQLQEHFGQNIFALTEEAVKELAKEKGAPNVDLLSVRLTIEAKIRLIERLYSKDPDDTDLEKQISDLMAQDKTLDNLSKLSNA